MIENLLQTVNHFGTKAEVLVIISSLQSSETIPKKDFLSIGIPRGAIELLNWLNIVNEADGMLKLAQFDEQQDHTLLILHSIFRKLAEEKQLHNLLNERSFQTSSDDIYIYNNVIPLRYAAIRDILVSFGLLRRDDISEYQYYISTEHLDWFKEHVTKFIENSQLGNNSHKKFKMNQQRQEKFGREAEEFVLEYEKKIRSDHPTSERIRIISDLDVSAGYDIQSYMNNNSCLIDKFIEVKSFAGDPKFYWSAKEVKVAREKRDRYFLYLVDRNVMNVDDYHPDKIQNPASTLFKDTKWECENDGYYFYRK